MSNDIEALIAEMKAAAEKATPGEWLHSYIAPYGKHFIVSNDGTTVINLSDGDVPACCVDLLVNSNPKNVLALIAALEQAQKSNEFLKGQLAELANFNPDWDKLEASYESWREIAAELLTAKNRIAELEAARYALTLTLCVKLPDSSSKAFWSRIGKTEQFHPETYKRWVKESIERACVIAGIKVEVK